MVQVELWSFTVQTAAIIGAAGGKKSEREKPLLKLIEKSWIGGSGWNVLQRGESTAREFIQFLPCTRFVVFDLPFTSY